jgi:hypothetical protein
MVILKVHDGEGRRVLLVSLTDAETERLRELRVQHRIPGYVLSHLSRLCLARAYTVGDSCFWLIGGAGTAKGEKRLRWLKRMIATSETEVSAWEMLELPLPTREEADRSSEEEEEL